MESGQMMKDDAAAWAIRLRRWHDAQAKFQPLPADRLGQMDFAYAVQESSIAHWIAEGGTIGAWKIGLTTPTMQNMCGVTEPIEGAVLAHLVRSSGCELRTADYGRLGLEMELAIRLAEVPIPGQDCSAEGLRPFVADVCAAFEVIDDRNADYSKLDACSLVADNSWNEGIVLGEPHAVDGMDGVGGRAGILRRSGEEVARGFTDDVSDGPLAMVSWVITALRRRGRELLPGQWVMTGSLVQTIFPRAGERYSFEIDGLPLVEVSIA